MVFVPVRLSKDVAVVVSPRELGEYANKLYAERTSANGVIDLKPADNGKYRTQDKWIPFFNDKGQRMISAPDVYRIGQIGSHDLVESVRADFHTAWLVTSTRITYNSNNLGARITHNFGSKVVAPTETRLVAPVYQNVALGRILETAEGRAYVSALFNTQDSPDVVAKTLATLSGKSTDNTYIWTPQQKSRAEHRERAVDFDSDGEGFHVFGYNLPDSKYGFSRGVSAKPARKKRA